MASMNLDSNHLYVVALCGSYKDACSLIDETPILDPCHFRLFCSNDYYDYPSTPPDYKLIHGNLSTSSLDVIRDTFHDELNLFAFVVRQKAAELIIDQDLTVNFEVTNHWRSVPMEQQFCITLSGDEEQLMIAKLSLG